MSDIKVSVIIPSFNRASVLERAIKSVLNQTYKNFELIIINDGSTDNTQELLGHYSDYKIIDTKNYGVSCARNTGLTHATGEWIAFLDSDDEWLPNKLEKQIQFIKENPDIFLVHGDEIWIRNGVRVNPKNKHKKGGGDQFCASLKLCAISPSVALIKKELLDEFGGFNPDYPVCEDYDLWLKITQKYPIGFIDDFLIMKYGGHEDQLSQKYKAMDYWRIKSIENLLKNGDLSPRQEEVALEEIFSKCKILLKGYTKHGNTNSDYCEIKKIYEYYFS